MTYSPQKSSTRIHIRKALVLFLIPPENERVPFIVEIGPLSGWWFQILFYFHPYLGENDENLIFFQNWVGSTTNSLFLVSEQKKDVRFKLSVFTSQDFGGDVEASLCLRLGKPQLGLGLFFLWYLSSTWNPNGGFLKWWYPTNMVFLLKMIVLGCEMGGTTI